VKHQEGAVHRIGARLDQRKEHERLIMVELDGVDACDIGWCAHGFAFLFTLRRAAG